MADISMYAVVASFPEAEERFDGFEDRKSIPRSLAGDLEELLYT